MDDCSLWQFTAAVEGWNRANSDNDMPEPPTPDEYYEMVRKYH